MVIIMMNINETNLYKVFRDFYTLTNIKIVLFNKEREVLLEYPSTKNTFCNLISKSEYWSEKCAYCDRKNIEICSKTGKTSEYFCHLGLFEAVTPIYDNNGILGYVMFGQVLVNNDKFNKTKEMLKKNFREEEFPLINGAIENIPVKSPAELAACVTVLQAITTYMLSNQWVVPQRSEFIRHMDNFIQGNIGNEISIDDICAEFHIRRTRMYSIAKDYLGCSIALYIRKQRIKHALKLLEETDETVTDIAYTVGFSDYGHFSRVFRKLVGISARDYRKQNRQRLKKNENGDNNIVL